MKKKILTVVLLLCGLIAFAAETAPAALLKNGNFAQIVNGNPTGWQCVYAKGAFSATGEGADRVIALNRQDAKGACMLVQKQLPLAIDKSYLFSCEVRSLDEGDTMVYVEWRVPTGDGKFRHSSVNAKKIAAGEEWKEIAFVIPPRTKECEAPYLVLSVLAGKVEFRNLVLEEKK